MARPKLSAGAVIVHRQDNQWRFLLLRAFQYWDFPKGMVEPGEEPLAGALREVEEETTLTGLVFSWGQANIETAPYNHGKKYARYYLAESPTMKVMLPVSPLLGRPEHNEYRWVSYSEAESLVTLRVRRVLEWAWKRMQEEEGAGN